MWILPFRPRNGTPDRPRLPPERRPSRPAPLVIAVLLGAFLLPACVDRATEHRVRANAFLRGGDAAAALRECDLGLEQAGRDSGLFVLRGKALFELDRLDEARGAYEQALAAGKAKNQPDQAFAEVYLGLAIIASRQKNWQAAREQFEALVRINDKDATSHLNVARTCLELKDVTCAISHGETAGKLRGNDEGVLYTLGTIYLAAGKPKEAELTFEHICEVVPDAASCPYGVALVAARTGDKPRAIARLRQAIDRKIPNPGQMATEPGFASIKDDPEFLELVAKANPRQP
jgi:tetratricopeptide (TPR) repeat protein